jgi:hypothetical protein
MFASSSFSAPVSPSSGVSIPGTYVRNCLLFFSLCVYLSFFPNVCLYFFRSVCIGVCLIISSLSVSAFFPAEMAASARWNSGELIVWVTRWQR